MENMQQAQARVVKHVHIPTPNHTKMNSANTYDLIFSQPENGKVREKMGAIKPMQMCRTCGEHTVSGERANMENM